MLKEGDACIVLSSLNKYKGNEITNLVIKASFIRGHHKISLIDMVKNLATLNVKNTYVFYIGDIHTNYKKENPTEV